MFLCASTISRSTRSPFRRSLALIAACLSRVLSLHPAVANGRRGPCRLDGTSGTNRPATHHRTMASGTPGHVRRDDAACGPFTASGGDAGHGRRPVGVRAHASPARSAAVCRSGRRDQRGSAARERYLLPSEPPHFAHSRPRCHVRAFTVGIRPGNKTGQPPIPRL